MNKKLPAWLTESVLWLKRLMIITGIYFYAAHFIASIVDSRLRLFELNGASYSLVNESIIGDEVSAKVAYEKRK
jgi:hypothetical protein